MKNIETEYQIIELKENISNYFKSLIEQRNILDSQINRELALIAETHYDTTGKDIKLDLENNKILVTNKKD
jgi:hypothetical protein